MTNRFNIALFFILPLLFISCADCIDGTGTNLEERRSVEEYDVLYIDCELNVLVRQAGLTDQNKILVKAQENLLPFIKTDVNGDRLTVELSECIRPTEEIQVEIITNGIVKLVHSGSGSVETLGALKADDFKIVSEGSGDLSCKIKTSDLEVDASGSGNIMLSGDANDLEIDLDGSGDVNSLSLKANTVDASNDGSGTLSIYAKDEMSLSLSGSGDIRHSGSPQNSTISNNGSGSVVLID